MCDMYFKVSFHYAILGIMILELEYKAHVATTCNGACIVLQQVLIETALTALGV